MLKVRFSNFGADLLKTQSTLMSIFRKNGVDLEIVKSHLDFVDLEIFSNTQYPFFLRKNVDRLLSKSSESKRLSFLLKKNFGFNPNEAVRFRKSIWITGENIRPMHGNFDVTLTFDKTDISEKNIFFPFWFHNLSWDSSSKDSFRVSVDRLQSDRSAMRKMNHGVCTFSSYVDPYRENSLRILERYFDIAKYGRAYGDLVADKNDVASDFLLQFCPENTLYPNYVTEKLFDAWRCQNVPIWAGIDADGYLNREAYFDISLLSSSEFDQKFRNVSIDSIYEMQKKPLLSRDPDLENTTRNILDLLNI